jgi:hypothetical protein
MPTFLTDAAEGIVAIFTDGNTIRHWRQLGLISVRIERKAFLLVRRVNVI